jgi:hypothetical protein
MPNTTNMITAAKGLAKNPLGIIALFIVMIYGFAALTLGATNHLTESERLPLAWFLVIFPVIVLGTFGWLVSQHHEKLYAPADYRNDQDFWNGVNKTQRTERIQEQQDIVKAKMHDLVKDLAEKAKDNAANSKDINIEEALSKVDDEIESATTITVDARGFTNNSEAIFKFPAAAFECLSDLTNEIYFKICNLVGPYEYGHTWLLRDAATKKVIQNVRMIAKMAPGRPLTDNRPLNEVGIKPGNYLVVERP